MSNQSKYYQVTNQILLEYKTDQYKITTTHAEEGSDVTDIYMYCCDDGKQYCMDKTNIPTSKYPEQKSSRYYYGGPGVTEFTLKDYQELPIYGSDIYINNHNIGVIIKDQDNKECRQNISLNRDTIRLYLLSGYVMNNIAGYALRVKGLVDQVSYTDMNANVIYKRIHDYLYLLDWFMPKEELKDRIHWLPNPLYLNSKFYDRYIEIKFPAPLDVALHPQRNINYVYEQKEVNDEGEEYSIYMRGNINPNMNFIIEFATVQQDYMEMNTEIMYECTFTPDVARQVALSRSSNANNFNVRIIEDTDSHQILYYPVYGDLLDEKDMDITMMQAIDSGIISMIDSADMDYANQGMDEFIEMYGEDVYRWVIINELTVSYNYEDIITPDMDNQLESYTEYFTNTIDYTGKTSDNGEFWKTKFIPTIHERNNKTCKSIILSYTAHLFNRMNNIDIIRTASMTITDPYKYTLPSINTNNIVQYKVVNKIHKNVINPVQGKGEGMNAQIIRDYYDATNVVMRDVENNVSYQQGKMTLKLKHTNNNYLIRLYELKSDNS